MRAIAACPIRVGVTASFMLMRVHRVIVAALAVMSIAMVYRARRVFKLERHALPGDHRGHALNGHDESDSDSKKANEA